MNNNAAVQFVEENMKTIFAYALSRVSNKEDAEDLTSDIILAILKSGDKIKDTRAFYGFVWKIAANTYTNFLRKRNRNQHEELNESMLSNIDFVDEICDREDINILRRELSLLSREYRECTIAYYIEGLSCAQTAERLGISLEMTKYYLFKTRKLLKEGIGMDREYGEKSYNPATFYFETIFTGDYNAEYRNLFNRKLPGNVILSTYYTPMTIRELSLELGVASPYLEDEVKLLVKYDLLRKVKGEKYQANLVVFTEAFISEFFKKAEADLTNKLKSLLSSVKNKLYDIRNVGFIGNQLDDNRLLWPLLWMLMRSGHEKFEQINLESCTKDNLYKGATGINYGVDYNDFPLGEAYHCPDFAGFCGIDDHYGIAFADFGVLPENVRFINKQEEYKTKFYYSLNNRECATLPIFSVDELTNIESILSSEIDAMEIIYAYLTDVSSSIMRNHAPGYVIDMVHHIVSSSIFFQTAGLIGKCAIDSGELFVSEETESPALYGYNYNETKLAMNDVLCK